MSPEDLIYPNPTDENTIVKHDKRYDHEDNCYYPVTYAQQTLPDGTKMLSRFTEHLHPLIVYQRLINNRAIDAQVKR